MNFQKITKWEWIIYGLVIGVLLILFLRECGTKNSTLPPATQQRIDSLRATEASSRALHDTVRKENTTRARIGNIALARASRLVVVATRIGERADTFALLARRADSAMAASSRAESLWHAAYDSRTQERDSLRIALDSTNRVVVRQAISLRADSVEMDRQSQRVDALETLNKRIAHDVVAINRCDLVRIVRFAIPCPTRKEAFAAGIGFAAATVIVYTAVKK